MTCHADLDFFSRFNPIREDENLLRENQNNSRTLSGIPFSEETDTNTDKSVY